MANNKDIQRHTRRAGAALMAGLDTARLVCLDDKFAALQWELSGAAQIVGRDAQADLRLEDGQISRQHARVSCEAGQWTLEDLNSSNGVLVNGKKINRSLLSNGDVVMFGALAFRFEQELAAATMLANVDNAAGVDQNATMLAPLAASPVVARLISRDEQYPGLEFTLGKDSVCMGREAGVALHVDHKKISRQHAQFSYTGAGWQVADLQSTNGVRVNGEQVQQAQLQDGDLLQVGPVKFQFVLQAAGGVAPVAAAEEEDEAGTMLFDDVRASEVLIKAIEEEQAQAQIAAPPAAAAPTPAPASAREPARPAVSRPAAPAAVAPAAAPAAKAKFSLRPMTAVFIGVGAALLVTVVFLASGRHEREVEVQNSVARVQALLTGMEEENVVVNGPQYIKQMEEIRNAAAQVNLAASHYPQDSALLRAQAQLMFLTFERDLQRLLQDGMAQEALELIADNQGKVKQLTAQGPAAAADRAIIDDIGDLLELSVVMVRLNAFAQRFPDPVAANERGAPSAFDLKEAQQHKKTFIELKKKNHLAISVTYPYFQRMVEKVDENSLRVINRWDDLSRRADTEAP